MVFYLKWLPILIIPFCLMISTYSFSQDLIDDKIIENNLSATASFNKIQSSYGENIELTIQIELLPGFTAYVEKFELNFLTPGHIPHTQPEISPTIEFADPFSKELKKGVRNKSTLKSILEIPNQFPLGEQEIQFELSYQTCTKTYCLFPQQKTFALNLNVTSNLEDTPHLYHKASNSLFDKLFNYGLFWTFLLVFLAGILTSFTPCIFPMIPITLSVVSNLSENKSKTYTLLLSIIYVLGIAITYSTLGVIAASTGALFGSFLGHPVVVYSLCILFILMGFSLFGLFEIQTLTLKINHPSIKIKNPYFKGFISGLFAGIIASPCVGPVLVSILAYVAQTQNLLLGFSLLFVFAVGMSLLLIALAMTSKLIDYLPKAGSWMNIFKNILALSMLGLSIYIIHPLLPTDLLWIVSGLIFTLPAFFYWTIKRNSLDQISKIIINTIFALGLLLCFLGLYKIMHEQSSIAEKKSSAINWVTYTETIFTESIQSKKPMVIDFYADWCLACKELEHKTFSHPEMKPYNDKIIFLKFNATHPSESLRRLQNKFNIQGLPTLLFFDDNGAWLNDLTLNQFEDHQSFQKRLDHLLKTNPK